VSEADAGPLVFLLEDEDDIAALVVRALESFGMRVERFARGRDFLARFAKEPPDLAILDLGLPDIDGLDIVKAVRRQGGTGILVVTGRTETADRVLGLELGADDYVVKPFEPRELVARARSVLRRLAGPDAAAAPTTGIARFAGFAFSTATNALTTPAGETRPLSVAEAALLVLLLKAPNRILSRDQLMDGLGIAAQRTPFDRSVDVRVSRLRRKLDDTAAEPTLIRTVYGAGYLFNARVTWGAGE
jgi:two-component system OmpR family response regulator